MAAATELDDAGPLLAGRGSPARWPPADRRRSRPRGPRQPAPAGRRRSGSGSADTSSRITSQPRGRTGSARAAGRGRSRAARCGPPAGREPPWSRRTRTSASPPHHPGSLLANTAVTPRPRRYPRARVHAMSTRRRDRHQRGLRGPLALPNPYGRPGPPSPAGGSGRLLRRLGALGGRPDRRVLPGRPGGGHLRDRGRAEPAAVLGRRPGAAGRGRGGRRRADGAGGGLPPPARAPRGQPARAADPGLPHDRRAAVGADRPTGQRTSTPKTGWRTRGSALFASRRGLRSRPLAPWVSAPDGRVELHLRGSAGHVR